MISAGQRTQEGDHSVDLLVRQRPIQLSNTHPPHSFLESRSAAVMEIGRRRRHVAEAGDAQDLGLRRGKRMKYAVPFEEIAADIHALMAGDAAE